MEIPAKLRWQCRRGSKELDLLLQSYLRERYVCADEPERQQFEALLQLDDLELASRMISGPALQGLGFLPPPAKGIV